MVELSSIDTLIGILQKCRKIRNLEYAKHLHAQVCNNGLESHRVVGNYIVPMLVDCGSVSDAQQVFNKLLHRNVHSWTSLMLGYVECGQSQRALNLYQEMQEDSVHPNNFTFIALLKACGRLKDLENGREIHVDIAEKGFENDVFVGSTLVDTYAKCGSLVEARKAFDKLPIRTVVSWNALIAGYAEHGPGREALRCFEQMELEGIPPDAVTFVYILKVCGRIGASDKGREVHADLAQRGFERDIFVGSTLVDMYAKCGALAEAQEVFNMLPTRNVISWNALIAGYADHGLGHEVLECFEHMQQEGLSPDVVTFICTLKACGTIRDIDRGRELHADITHKGFERDVNVSNTLVDMYSKCGSLVEAREVFDKLTVRDAVSWNALIAGYAEHGPGNEALKCFHQMQVEGVSPDAVTFVCILKTCGSIGAIEEGREIHAGISQMGFEQDVSVGNSVVDMYVKCCSLADAQEVFDKLQVRNVVSWNSLVAGYSEHGPGQEALKCFEQMQLEGVSPNAVTFVCALKACGSIGAIDKGRKMHADMTQMGFETEFFVGDTLVDMYVKCGSLAEAQRVFDKLLVQKVESWSALIAGYTDLGPVQEALKCFEQMQLEGTSPDLVTLVCVLKACGTIGAIEKGREVHAVIAQKGLEGDSVAGSTLVDMYAKCGSLAEAFEVFYKLPDQDVVSWTAMVKGYGINYEGSMAVQCFERMQELGVRPDGITFTCLLSACSRASLVCKGKELFNVMREKYGILPTIDHYTCIIDLLGKSGHLYEAEEFLQTKACPSLWTVLLSACKIYGDAELGLRCFWQLVQINPECAAPYVLMSKIYASAGRLDDAHRIEELRKQAGARKKPASALTEVNSKVHGFVVGANDSKEVWAMLEILSLRMQKEGHVPYVNLVL